MFRSSMAYFGSLPKLGIMQIRFYIYCSRSTKSPRTRLLFDTLESVAGYFNGAGLSPLANRILWRRMVKTPCKAMKSNVGVAVTDSSATLVPETDGGPHIEIDNDTTFEAQVRYTPSFSWKSKFIGIRERKESEEITNARLTPSSLVSQSF
jgi:hypothetical protein